MGNVSTVKVRLEDVMENLKLVSSYLGGKRESTAVDYDRVAAINCDSALVALLMEDAALLVAGTLPQGLLRWRYTRGALEFELAEGVDVLGLQPALVRAVSLQVLRRWLRIVGSDYADTVSESAAASADSLAIYFRDVVVSSAPGAVAHPRRIPPI